MDSMWKPSKVNTKRMKTHVVFHQMSIMFTTITSYIYHNFLVFISSKYPSVYPLSTFFTVSAVKRFCCALVATSHTVTVVCSCDN